MAEEEKKKKVTDDPSANAIVADAIKAQIKKELEERLAREIKERLASEGASAITNTAPGAATATESSLGIGAGASQPIMSSSEVAGQIGTNIDGTAIMGSAADSAGAAEGAGTTLGDAASIAGALYGAYRTYGAATNDNLDAKERAFQTQRQAALTVANYFGFGLPGLADGLLRANNKTAKWMNKFDELDRKYGALGHVSSLISPVFGDISSHQREITDFAKLAQDGVYIPDEILLQASENKRRTFDEMERTDLGEDFIGRDLDGNWVNNRFNTTRDVKDLRPVDVVNYSTWAEKDPDWFNKSLPERLQISRDALRAGAIEEGHGQIGVDWGKLDQYRSTLPPPVVTDPTSAPSAVSDPAAPPVDPSATPAPQAAHYPTLVPQGYQSPIPQPKPIVNPIAAGLMPESPTTGLMNLTPQGPLGSGMVPSSAMDYLKFGLQGRA